GRRLDDQAPGDRRRLEPGGSAGCHRRGTRRISERAFLGGPPLQAARGSCRTAPAYATRRVVTGIDGTGRSCVLSDEVLLAPGVSPPIWNAVRADLPAWALALGVAEIPVNQPLPGSRFSLVALPGRSTSSNSRGTRSPGWTPRASTPPGRSTT